jgi:hypothetical protein
MIQKTLILLFAVFTLASCQAQHKNKISNKEMSKTTKPDNPYYSRTDTTKLDLPDSVWKKVLPHDVYEVARHAATERAFTGKYWDFYGKGTYYCAACGNKLFRSDAKFASTCGWPSFYEPVRLNSVIYKPDN